MKNTRLALLGFILSSTPLAATAQWSGDFLYSVEFGLPNTVTITGYIGYGGDVTIPTFIAGYRVETIESGVFYGRDRLTSVTLPDGLRRIGSVAFAGTGLTHVTIPRTVGYIGGGAFSNCRALMEFTVNATNNHYSSLDGVLFDKTQTTLLQYPGGKVGSYLIPDTVAGIGSDAFSYCTGLVAITVGAANESYRSADGVLFDKNLTTLIQFPGGKSGGYAIPGSVTNIEAHAFNFCVSVTDITIPGGLTSIGDFMFENCTSLKGVTIPVTVTNIGRYALYNCAGLTRVGIPGSVTMIEDYAFQNCTNLTNVTISNGVTSIGNGAFWNCTSLTDVALPGSLTSLENAAFQYCTSLTNVTIGNGVTSIGNGAFGNCTSLTDVTIPGSVTSIGNAVFVFCTSLTSITIPGSVASIGDQAFVGCTSLTSITIPGSVTNIGGDAFAGCTGLTNVTIGNGVTSIRSGAFASCTSLIAINVDAANASYSSMDGVLFNKSLTTLIQCPARKAGSYSIPSSVAIIGESAFASCSSLTNITIANGVISIGDYAFAGTGLTAINVDAANASYSSADGVLFNKSLTTLLQCPRAKAGNYSLPDSVTSIKDHAFVYCASLTSITIPDNVTSIGDWAFVGCTSLQGVFFKGNAPSFGSYVFDYTSATIYYLPSTTGWGATFAGRPTRLWNPLMQTSGPNFGVGPAGFGFNITGTTNIPILVEATTNLANASWVALQSLNLTNGGFYFSDPDWTNYSARTYRIRSP